MRCPFPGMDPYIEQPEIWPDFHDRFITYLCSQLQPMLRPRFAALTQDRLYVIEHDRPIRPDVAVIETGFRDADSSAGGTAVATRVRTLVADAPSAVFELDREEIHEPVIHIVEPAEGNRIVTAIEVLSPENKRAGRGRDSYLRKREENWDGGINLIEIDLLRAGDPTVRVSVEKLATIEPHHYLTTVTRVFPCRQIVYGIPLRQRLPRIAVPLIDDDVALDLQAAFQRCWDEGPYPELLHYDRVPPGDLSDEDRQWCREKAARYREPN